MHKDSKLQQPKIKSNATTDVVSINNLLLPSDHRTKPDLEMNDIESVILENKEIKFTMEYCGCQRHLKNVVKNHPNLTLNQTTCSSDAFYRGPHQKVIGFSFYRHVNGSSHRRQGFFVGIVNNLKLLQKFYPGWIIRLYTDLDRNDTKLKDICDIACTV